MKTTKIAKIPIRIKSKTSRIKQIIHGGLMKNFLSAGQIIDYFRPVLLTELGSSIVSQEQSRVLKQSATPFGKRIKTCLS